MDLLRRLYDEYIRNWRELSPARQFGVIGVVAGILAFLALAVWLMAYQSYEPLFPGRLDPEVNGEIVAALEGAGIPSRLGGADDAQVLVPASQKARAMSVAGQAGALAGADTAFDFLDESQFGTIDQVLTLKNKRAKERQLRAVLRMYKFVRAAEVILTPEEKALLSRDQRPAQAAVQLDVVGEPPAEAIQGIVDTIRLSIPNLREDNIVVTNLYGRRLNKVRRDTLFEQTAEQYELVQAEQERIRRTVLEHLDGILGAGNAIVSIALEKNFDQVKHTAHEVDVENPGVLSEQRIREQSQDRGAGGEPGVGSNVPDTGIGGPSSGAGQREYEERIVNSVFSSTDTEVIKQVGRTTRLSAAVTVNHRRMVDAGGGITGQYEERPPEEMQRIERVVLASLPVETGGVPDVVVQQMRFDRTSEEVAELEVLAATRWDNVVNYWLPFAGLAAILLGLVLLMWYNARRSMRIQQRRAQAEMERAIAETRMRKKELSLMELGIGEVTDISQLPPEEQRRIKLAQKVEEFCREKPEDVANIVKTWLAE